MRYLIERPNISFYLHIRTTPRGQIMVEIMLLYVVMYTGRLVALSVKLPICSRFTHNDIADIGSWRKFPSEGWVEWRLKSNPNSGRGVFLFLGESGYPIHSVQCLFSMSLRSAGVGSCNPRPVWKGGKVSYCRWLTLGAE